MNGVAPIGSMQEYSHSKREDEIDRMEQKVASKPSEIEAPPQVVKSEVEKKAENTSLYGFRYTGIGSFIDKVF